MVIEKYSMKSNMPGFTAEESFIDSYETCQFLVKYHSDLSGLVTPAQDCFSSCTMDCPDRGIARKGCLTGCKFQCSCKQTIECIGCFSHCSSVPFGSLPACMNSFCPGCC
jgi:hypothetical protein